MVRHGRSVWDLHPHVGNDLTVGERAADKLKAAFGTWTLLFAIIAGIVFWMAFIVDPGELRLNLGLSFLASVQGVILQIAANRGDRLNAEVALHTQRNTDELMKQGAQIAEMNKTQLEILHELRAAREKP